MHKHLLTDTFRAMNGVLVVREGILRRLVKCLGPHICCVTRMPSRMHAPVQRADDCEAPAEYQALLW